MAVENAVSKVQAFDSHKPLYKLFVWLGFSELQTANRLFKYFHTIYRGLGCLILLYVCAKQVYYACLDVFYLKNVQWQGVVLVITDVCFVIKLACFVINTDKLNAINDMIKGPMFAANTRQNEEFIRKNISDCHKLYSVTFSILSMCIIVWNSHRNYIAWTSGLKKLPELYYAVDLESTTGLIKALMFLFLKSIWKIIGHVGLDIMVVSYYLQAVHQLRLIKFNLKRLFDDDMKLNRGWRRGRSLYLDESDEDIKRRFIYYIRRYNKVVWLMNNVSDIFGIGIAIHLLCITIAMCFGIYDASSVSIHSSAFLYWSLLLLSFLVENFFYCYFGSLLEYESDTVNSAIYSSNWTEVSPKCRRMILIAMSRWHYPIRMRVGGLVPLSLNTLVSTCRLAYSMFTVLVSLK